MAISTFFNFFNLRWICCITPTCGAPDPAIERQFRHRFHPILHCIDVLTAFFLFIYLGLVFLSPHLHSYQTSLPAVKDHSSLKCQTSLPYSQNSVIPSSSVCSCLNRIDSLVFSFYRLARPGSSHKNYRIKSFVFILTLLLLSGDVEMNPGPHTLSFASLNVRSACSTSAKLDKPCVTEEFIADKNIEILALTETWLKPDSPPNVVQSLAPPNYTVVNSPRVYVHRGGGAPYSTAFLNLLDSFDLAQHVNTSTHTGGHALELLISRSSSTLISNWTICDPLL